MQKFAEAGIAVETMATWHAIGNYNNLNFEERRVVGVFLPEKLGQKKHEFTGTYENKFED